ncbi:hypothetical protein ABPG72_002068 [Tetrahymena utriculariae]
MSPQASVQTNTQILQNMSNLSIENFDLHQKIKKSIMEKIEKEVNSQVAYKVLLALSSQIEGDEAKLLQFLSEYFRNFFYLYDYQELKSIEYIFMQSAKYIPLNFNCSLENEVEYKMQRLKIMNQLHTKNMIEQMKIVIPKGISVVFSKEDDRATITLNDSKKNLIIYGVDHGDYHSILKMKELLIKDKSARHFILEQPPMQYSEFQDTLDDGETNRDAKLKQMLFGGPTYTGGIGLKDSNQPDKLLKHYQKIPILMGDISRFYIDSYLLQQKNYYRLNDVERIIYAQEDGLAKPQEFATFVYNQIKRDKQNESKILLSDLSIEDEIYYQVTGQTNDQIKQQFNILKIVGISEQIDWAIKVYKSGCPSCTEGVKRGPYDIINACGETDYNFSLREKHIVKQTIKFMQTNSEADKFVMFVGNGHLLNILKYFLIEYNSQEFKQGSKQCSNFHEQILELNEVNPKIDYLKYDSDLDFLNKFSLYSSYFKTNRLLLPTELRNKQNLRDYEYFKNQYQQQLHANSFLNPSQQWVKQKGQEKCFALKTLNLC